MAESRGSAMSAPVHVPGRLTATGYVCVRHIRGSVYN